MNGVSGMSDFEKFDPRILVAEDAYERLLKIIRYRRLNLPVNWNRANQLINELGHLIHRVKYMFLPPSQLARLDEIREINRLSGELARLFLDRELLNRFKPDKLVVAKTKYSLRILYGLKYRLLLGDEPDPLYSIDIEGVEVTSVHKHPRADKLFVTRAEGILQYTIITNIRDIKRGEVRAAAILPPIEFMGIVSEAMYCSKPLSPEYKGKRTPHDLIDVKEVRSKIYEIMGRG
jgi:predicted RNA-binding protein with EMAP domain